MRKAKETAMNRRRVRIDELALLTACLLALLMPAALGGCSRDDQAGAQEGGTPGGAPSKGRATPAAEVPRNVRVLTLAPTELEEYLIISGSAAPLRGTDLSAEEGGHVAEIRHEKGARVRKGDALILLDRRLLEAEMRSAEAALALASYNGERIRQLFDANSVSQIELLDAETRERQAQAAADAARIRYERAAITAPFDGLVADRFVELGQLVAPGTPVGRIIDPYVLKLEGSVTEQEVRRIYQGETAFVSFEGVPEPVEGRVHFIGFEADRATGKFAVEVRVSNPDLAIRPGVIGRARVLKMTHADVLAVPRDAVQLIGGLPVVYVVEGDRARRRDLTLGASQGLMVIVEQGLAIGERLVVRGQRELHDGTLVNVQEVATSPDGTKSGDPGVVTQTQAVSNGRPNGAQR